MPHESFQSVSITSITDGAPTPATDRLAVEEPLEIRIGAQPLAVTMRTPGHDRELAAGFCLTEGIVRDVDDIESVEPCREPDAENVVIVTLTDDALAARRDRIAAAGRELYLSSSCGVCGKQSLDRIEQVVTPFGGQLGDQFGERRSERFTVSPAVLSALPARMRAAQDTFDATGGLHAAGLFTPAGELRLLREDVGRHNAVDKVIGAALLSGQTPIGPAVLLVSGRASFEIMQKAAMADVAFVAAVSAPSSLAVDFAKRFDMTLVGFLRDRRMNVYHDAGRLATDASPVSVLAPHSGQVAPEARRS